MLIGFLIKILIVINLLITMPRKRKGGGLTPKRKCKKHGNYTPDISAPKFPNRRNGVERQGSSIPPSIRDDLENNHDGSTPESRRRCYRMAIQYQYIEVMDAPPTKATGQVEVTRYQLFVKPFTCTPISEGQLNEHYKR